MTTRRFGGRRQALLDRFRLGAFGYYTPKASAEATLSVKADFKVGRAPGIELVCRLEGRS